MRCGAGRKIGSSVFKGSHEMPTIVYVDGFNLYYGLLRHSPHKWLDLVKFVEALLTDKYTVVRIKYFTARVAKNDDDPDMAIKQQQYLEALKSQEKVEVIEGVYKRFRVKLPFAKEPCRSCDKVQYATVIKTEEKMSDVNLASEMIVDAFEDKADAFVLISGDADQSAPLSIVRHKRNKVTVVFNPHEGNCHELRRFSTFCKNIPRDLPAKCRLPDEVKVGDRIVHCPEAWRA